MLNRTLRLAVALAAALIALGSSAQERFITLASTTSTEQSGLFGHVLPIFRQATGIEVRVVAVGTGQALTIGERGDADALLVHDRRGEERFVAAGHGIDRRDVMYNDFVLVGPATDPARIGGGRDAAAALGKVAAAQAPWVSRGDDSGTHRLELRLWGQAGVAVRAGLGWYRELGSGMGQTLNTASALAAYTVTDRATWASFKNRDNMAILVERDPALFNPYSSILVNPAKGGHIKAADARLWHEWLTSPAGRAAISSFKVGGEQLFHPVGAGTATN